MDICQWHSFQQSLNDGVETVQKLSIPAQSGDQVTLTIEASTEPGSTAGVAMPS